MQAAVVKGRVPGGDRLVATVTQDGVEYIVGVPVLGLTFRGPDLHELYDRALGAHADATAAGVLDWGHDRRRRDPYRLLGFLARAAILAVIGIVAVEALVSFAVSSLIAPNPIALRGTLFHVADELEAMRPETKEELRSALERIAVQVRPYLAELERALPADKAPNAP